MVTILLRTHGTEAGYILYSGNVVKLSGEMWTIGKVMATYSTEAVADGADREPQSLMGNIDWTASLVIRPGPMVIAPLRKIPPYVLTIPVELSMDGVLVVRVLEPIERGCCCRERSTGFVVRFRRAYLGQAYGLAKLFLCQSPYL
jgi:hypothetical protein